MKRPTILLLAVASRCLCAGTVAEEKPSVEGVYHMTGMYQSETIELRGGRFRYWYSTDTAPLRPDLPLEGTYTINDSKITLNRNDIILGKERIFRSFKGVDALWTSYALSLWYNKDEVNDLGILLRVVAPPDDLAHLLRPSNRDLYELKRK